MANLVTMEKISLKNNPEIKEDTIQKFIFDNPSVLGLGDLVSYQRERCQPHGGRLDMLLSDDEDNRYEVEIQLGATNPDHIIRTIEYWDEERKRFPQFDHCAVIVAEEVTGRFMNVISLFNGSIPIIALQMSAYKVNGDILLSFTKVLDRVVLLSDDEEVAEVTDRNYWDKKSSSKIMGEVDKIFQQMQSYIPKGFKFKYNKFYVGLEKDGTTNNFIIFRPKKSFIYLDIKAPLDTSTKAKLEENGLDVSYIRDSRYRIKVFNFKDYDVHKELIDEIVQSSLPE